MFIVVAIAEREVYNSVGPVKTKDAAIELANEQLISYLENMGYTGNLRESDDSENHLATEGEPCAWSNWRGEHFDAHIIEI